MIEEWLKPQVCYRLQDLADWLSLPTEELFFAAQRGEVRSLGEGPLHMTVLGADLIEFARARRLRWSVTPDGRKALGDGDGGIERPMHGRAGSWSPAEEIDDSDGAADTVESLL